MSTELTGLEIDEASGVDAPANGLPGWMVMKSEDAQATQAVEAQLATLYASIGGASALAGAPEDIRKAAETLSGYAEKQLTAPEPEPSLIEKMISVFKARPVPPQQDKGKWAAGDDADADDEVEAPAKPKMKKNKKDGAKVAQPNGTDDVQNTQDAQDVQKSLEPVRTELEEIKKAYEEDSLAIREAIVKMAERLEAVENELTGSSQVFGQEYDTSVEKAAGPSLRDGIMSAFSGNRVTLS